jgi:hypothetical protein
MDYNNYGSRHTVRSLVGLSISEVQGTVKNKIDLVN